MIDRIKDAIDTCDQQIDGRDDEYGQIWTEIRDTLSACLEKIGMRVECPRCGATFYADEGDDDSYRCSECNLVVG